MDSPIVRNRSLLAVSLSVSTAYAGLGMVLPVRVLYAQSQGASLAILSAMASGYLVSNFLFQYPAGWVADRFGRVKTMVAALLVEAILTVAYLFISDPLAFVGLRVLEGIATGPILPAGRAVIAEVVPPAEQGAAYGGFNTLFNAGFLLGPAIGGLLAATGYNSAFIGSCVLRLAAIVVVLPLIRGEPAESAQEQSPPDSVSFTALFSRALLGAYIVTLGDYLWVGFEIALIPVWMHDHLAATVTLIGLAYAAWALPNVLLSQLGGRLADARRRSLIVLIFGLLQVPMYVGYGLSTSYWPALIIFIVHGGVFALMQPSVDAHLGAASPAGARARSQSIYTGFGLGSAFVGATGLAALYGVDFRLPFFAMAISFALCVVIGSALMRGSERAATSRGAPATQAGQ